VLGSRRRHRFQLRFMAVTWRRIAGCCDPHGLEFHDGGLVFFDVGMRPSWPNHDRPIAGWIFKIEMA
jgi:hypothetical protein